MSGDAVCSAPATNANQPLFSSACLFAVVRFVIAVVLRRRRFPNNGRVEMLSGTEDKAKGGNDFQAVREVLLFSYSFHRNPNDNMKLTSVMDIPLALDSARRT